LEKLRENAFDDLAVSVLRFRHIFYLSK
jgi:hypothetical protein